MNLTIHTYDDKKNLSLNIFTIIVLIFVFVSILIGYKVYEHDYGKQIARKINMAGMQRWLGYNYLVQVFITSEGDIQDHEDTRRKIVRNIDILLNGGKLKLSTNEITTGLDNTTLSPAPNKIIRDLLIEQQSVLGDYFRVGSSLLQAEQNSEEYQQRTIEFLQEFSRFYTVVDRTVLEFEKYHYQRQTNLIYLELLVLVIFIILVVWFSRQQLHMTQSLRQNENQFRQTIENAPFPAIIHTCEGDIQFVNKIWIELTGYQLHDIPTIRDWIKKTGDLNDEAQERLRVQFFSVFETHNNDMEYRFKNKAGDDRVWLMNSSYLNPNPDGRKIIISMANDITNRKRAEAAYDVLVNQSIQGLFIIQDNKIVFANNRFCEMSGFSLEELYSFDYAQMKNIVHPDDQDFVWGRYERRLQGSKEPPLYDFRGWRKNKETYWMRIFSNRIEYCGRPAVQVAALDVTDQKKLENDLLQTQKIDSIGHLAGGIAHDFNNILMAIKINTEFALMNAADLGLREKFHDELSEIMSASDRASALTRQLLAFSRKQILDPKVINLNDLTMNLDKMLRRLIGENIELVSKLDPTLGNVKADAGQIEQVLLNLVVNARDAMPQGGRISIETQNSELDEDYTSKHVDLIPGKYVSISVSDNGNGISKEIQEKIFEPFFTTKEKGKGTGLGLSTTYGIVKQSGGVIYLYSEIRMGTTFRIFLPRVDEAVETEDQKVDIHNLHGNKTILVAEDDESVCQIVKRILTEFHYTVMTAPNGKEALRLLKTAQAPIHLLISDVILPEMNGKELIDQAIQLLPHLKIMFMSGYPGDNTIHQSIIDSNYEFIQKPFTSTDLLIKVKEVLET